MPRPKGTPNKPKEALDPGLAKLATIALDMNLDESVRQEASQVLTKAMNPAPHPEPQRKEYVDQTTNKWECACDWFSAEGMCTYCRAEWDIDPRNPKNKPAPPPDDPQAVAAFEKELDQLERDLGELGL